MKVGDRVETPDGSHHDILYISVDNGIQLSDYRWYCRSELKLVNNKPTKTELIDKAIDDLGGDISNSANYGFNGYTNLFTSKITGNYWVSPCYKPVYEVDEFVCTSREFEQRKKEREMEKNTHWYDYENQKMLRSPPVGEIVLVNTQSGERKAKVLEVTHNGTKEIFIVRVFNGKVEGIGDLNYKDEAKPLDWDKLSKRNKTVNTALYIFAEGLNDVKGLEKLYDAGMLKLP